MVRFETCTEAVLQPRSLCTFILGHLFTQGLFPTQQLVLVGLKPGEAIAVVLEVKGSALPVFHFSLHYHGFYEVCPSLYVLRHWIVFALKLTTPYGVALVLVVHRQLQSSSGQDLVGRTRALH